MYDKLKKTGNPQEDQGLKNNYAISIYYEHYYPIVLLSCIVSHFIEIQDLGGPLSTI